MEPVTRECYAEAYVHGRLVTVRFLMAKGFSHDLAEETAQAAWVRGWERRMQLRDPGRTLAWVNTIAFHLGCSQCRRDAQLTELAEEPTASSHDIETAVDACSALERCPDKERCLLEKRYLHGCELADLAAEHRCTDLAIRLRLHRARKHLREILSEA